MTRLGGVLTLAITASLSLGSATSQDDTLVWLDDYEQALALAKQTGMPLFVEFRCGP